NSVSSSVALLKSPKRNWPKGLPGLSQDYLVLVSVVVVVLVVVLEVVVVLSPPQPTERRANEQRRAKATNFFMGKDLISKDERGTYETSENKNGSKSRNAARSIP